MAVDWENLSDDELMNLPDPEGSEDIDFFTDGEAATLETEIDTPQDPEDDELDEEEVQTKPKQTAADDPAAEGDAGEEAVDEDESDGDDNGSDAAGESDAGDNSAEAGADGDLDLEEAAKVKAKQTDDAKNADADVNKDGGKEAAKSTEEPDYKALYEQMTAPFKANGRDFKVESPDEAVRLMQQGANYVKKMTALKPNLKLMRMLQNQDLLDEDKLTFLIDVNRRDPAAIQKLLKDGGIDPMDINTDEEPKYKPGDHKVSDEDMAFRSTLDDVLASSTGSATVKTINDTWDTKSKEEVYRDPDILKLMDQHRQTGIYEKIATEIDRQRTLGDLSDNTTFLEAYKTVGDKLHAAGRLFPDQKQVAPAGSPNAPAPQGQTRQPVGKSNPKRKQASNGDRAKAASPTRTAPKGPAREFDPFAMTDDELMKVTSNQF